MLFRLEKSQLRLPAALANKVYDAGESGMGYRLFKVVLRDGSELPCAAGSAVDFPDLTDGVTSTDVIDVLPHTGSTGRGGPPARMGLDYLWCLYSPLDSLS